MLGNRDYEAMYVAWDTARCYIGTWYKWGGDDPAGFDCSGFVGELLRSAGVLTDGPKLNAAMLYEKFKIKKVKRPYRGCLVFCFKDNVCKHVEFMRDDQRTMGASGGGPHIDSPQDAIAANAFIKTRPISRLTNKGFDTFVFVDPFKN